MAETSSIWFRIGYALENARQESPARRLRGLTERADDGDEEYEPPVTSGRRSSAAVSGPKDEPAPGRRQREHAEAVTPWQDPFNALVTAGAGALVSKLIGLIPARRKPGMIGMVRAGAAGAGAAMLRELLDPLLRGEARLAHLGPRAGDALMAGAARGLLYASVLEPRLPGPSVVQGVLYGSAEYAVSPWGGLTTLLGERAPHRKLPLLNNLFDDYQTGDTTYLDHLVFGVALALFYGAIAEDDNSGTEDEE